MARPLRCLITDDEPFVRKGLQGYAEQTAFLKLRDLCADRGEPKLARGLRIGRLLNQNALGIS